MRVLGRALLVGCLASICSPPAVFAAPILVDGSEGGLCTGLVAETTTNCRVFALAFPGMIGEFGLDSDVALFAFELAQATMFSATTTSYGNGTNFDPSLALFYGDGQHLGEIVTFTDADGASFAAKGTDIDGTNFDDHLALALGPGSYLLALYKFPNGATIDLASGLDSLLAGFECDLTTSCDGAAGGSTFAFSVSADDGGPAPVPEPGTLTLMAGGAVAGLIQRLRSKKRNRAEQVSR